MHFYLKKLIIFIKAPIPGKVKTRLAKDIGNTNAAIIYKAMVNDLRNNLAGCQEKIVFFLNELSYSREFFFEQNSYLKANSNIFHQQTGKNLGEKMANAFINTFNLGSDLVLLIGSDIPHISDELIRQYFVHLENHQIVIGPAKDGGYYLIGFQQDAFCHDIFRNISWSTDKVFQQTLTKIRKNKLTCYIGPVYRDLDTLSDLKEILKQEQWKKYLFHLNKKMHLI